MMHNKGVVRAAEGGLPISSLTGKSPAFSSGTVVLAAIPLRAPQDLVSLRRQTRDVAEQFGVPERSIRSLSAATYEAGRLLIQSNESGTADLSIGATGQLEVTIRVDNSAHNPLPPGLSESLSRLSAVVTRVSIEHIEGSIAVTLATSLPAGGPHQRPAPLRVVDAPLRPGAETTDVGLVEENIRLRRAIAELQTELDETNRGVVALFAELDGQAEKLREANRAKEDFLATLSHELRTPLNAMLGWTRLVRMGKLDHAAMERALDTIERNAHVQEQLIADILDVSRIVTGKLRLVLRPLDLEPVIDAAMDALRPAADAKGIQLECTLTHPGAVMGDPDRLQQVVWNLLSNSIKFTPAGGRVALSVKREGANVRITVTDTGEGMPSTLVPFVFDRFTQGDGSLTRPHGGLGLGLSIVRHIVELHGGEVDAHSEGPGKGSTFAVTLPARSAERRAAPVDNEDSAQIA
jgi:signal transduction histidine kinase